MRVALYARYSSDLQRAESIEDQVRVCQARAVHEGWSVVEVFSDAAVSGATLTPPTPRADFRVAPRAIPAARNDGRVIISGGRYQVGSTRSAASCTRPGWTVGRDPGPATSAFDDTSTR
jgi:hypothetical protein